MVHAQFLQVVDTCLFAQRALGTFFGQSQELTLVGDARYRVDGEVTVVHFVHHDVGKATQCRTYIVFPTFRVSRIEVEHGGTLSVHTHGLRHDAWSIAQPLAVHLHVEGIELAVQVFLNRHLPSAVLSLFHRDSLVGRAFVSRFIQQNLHLIRHGRPKRELGFHRRVIHLGEVSFPHRIIVERRSFLLYRLATDGCRNNPCQNQTFYIHFTKLFYY